MLNHQVHRFIDEIMRDNHNRKYNEELVCKMIKKGSKLPDSDVIVRMIGEIFPDDRLDGLEGQDRAVAQSIVTGLMALLQLCVTKEKM